MASGEHLILKGKTYYALLVVPKAARAALKRSRFKTSLKTDSLAKADVLKLPYVAEWKRKIGLALAGKSDPMARMREAALEFRAARMETHGTEDLEWGRHESTHDEELLSLLDEEAKVIEERHGLEASRQFRAIATSDAAMVEDTYETWLAQSEDAEQTKVQHKATIKRFITWAKLEATTAIPRTKAGDYINELLSSSGLSRRTVERHASSLSALWRWYVARGMAKENPWKGHQLSSKKHKKQNQRHGLSDDSLVKLLTTVYGIGYYRQLHPDLLRIGLVTGARIEALCALKRSDVLKRDDGYWFSIQRDKTEAGEREIPVHPAVNGIIERRLADGDAYLFKGLIPGGVEKKRSHHVSKAYARFRKAAGVTGQGEVFHALRNTFIECMEGHGVPESTVKLMVGHKRDSMTYGHYSKGTKVDLRAAVSRLDYGEKIMSLIRDQRSTEAAAPAASQ